MRPDEEKRIVAMTGWMLLAAFCTLMAMNAFATDEVRLYPVNGENMQTPQCQQISKHHQYTRMNVTMASNRFHYVVVASPSSGVHTDSIVVRYVVDREAAEQALVRLQDVTNTAIEHGCLEFTAEAPSAVPSNLQ